MKFFSFSLVKPGEHKNLYAALALLTAIYLAGVVGLSLAVTETLFRKLTPLSLLLSAGLLFSFHKNPSQAFYFYVVTAYLVGFFVEVLGVHTGQVFGQYAYGGTLGFKVWEVPLLIGVNWLVLSYAAGCLADRFPLSRPLKACLGASLLVLLDFFIEPVAIALDFWQWADAQVPMQNYLGWWLVAFLLEFLFLSLPINRQNPLASFFYFIQFLFFLILFLFTL